MSEPPSQPPDAETIGLDLLLEAILRKSGYDFRDYARASLQRRLATQMIASDCVHLADMIPRVLHDEQFLEQLLHSLSITVTRMFRDPEFYLALQQEVFPELHSRRSLKIWHAGCATGEEVYSVAILLEEAGLYDRARIYATDFNSRALHTAQAGIYPLETIRRATADYVAVGGLHSLANYYYAQYGSAKVSDNLQRNVHFSHHNLATDGAFGAMDLILCRNVMIYFDRNLQERAFQIFTDSLNPAGFLCLGSKETLEFSTLRACFEELVPQQRIYRREAASTTTTTTCGP